jgi:hypothetical protein
MNMIIYDTVQSSTKLPGSYAVQLNAYNGSYSVKLLHQFRFLQVFTRLTL